MGIETLKPFKGYTPTTDPDERPVLWVPDLNPLEQAGPCFSATSRTTPVGMLNRDGLVATHNPDDPYRIIEELLDTGSVGSSSGGDRGENCILIRNPGLPHLNVAHLFAGTTAPSTPPIVRCFGAKAPRSCGGIGFNIWPGDYDGQISVFPKLKDELEDFIWRPCYSQDTTPLHALTLDTAAEVINRTIAPAFSLAHGNKFWFVQDYDYILVTVATAAIGPSASVIQGWFSS